MNSKLLLRLIKSSMDKSRHVRIPFLFVGVFTIMTFYIIASMVFSDFLIRDGKDVFYGATQISMILMIGCFVIALISTVVILYANAFVMKDRRREIGLYGILGLTKKSIVLMLFYETVIHLVICLGGGLLIGSFLNKLMVLILYKLAGEPPVNGFVFSVYSIGLTVILYLLIYAICFIYNVFSIQISKPVELIRSRETGEKEPKAKKVTLIIGVATLAVGYYYAINCESTFDSFNTLFIAIIMVVMATYCLFTAGTIALLKAIKKNKKLYYKTGNFVGVANLMYRMKHNAVGLASICILSTAVIILISCVVSLVALSERTLDRKFPSDVMIYYASDESEVAERFNETVEDIDYLEAEKIETRDLWTTSWLQSAEDETGEFSYMSEMDYFDINSWRTIYIVTQNTYNRFADEPINLNEGEVCIADTANNDYSYLSCGDVYYTASEEKLDQDVMKPFTDPTMDLIVGVYIIVPDEATGFDIVKNDPAVVSTRGSEYEKNYVSSFNLRKDISDEERADIRNRLSAIVANADISFREEDEQFFKSLYGGVMFVGVFLAIIFAMVTVLIIYYKQMSEGYEDNGRYQILKKVGLTENEVIRSINRQVMIMFFLPIAAAAVHAVVASNIIRLFMKMLLYVDAFTFNMAIFGSVMFFAVIYCVVYRITSKQYYKIVSFDMTK
ncbi:MAG: ABC transporter permease [Lachnospiraceae bacterium]|nr:ABC transporter permease [Lachnospiraceae bacterium]